MDGGYTRDQWSYFSRVRIICTTLMGPRFYGLIDEADGIDWRHDPQLVEPLYSSAFELIRDAWNRVQLESEECEKLVQLRNGKGDPGIRAALKEAYDELSEGYAYCLVELVKQKKGSGDDVTAELCESRLNDLGLLRSEIFSLPASDL